MDQWTSLLFVPGAVLTALGVIWALVGARRSNEEWLRGVRLRYLGLALLFLLPGAGLAFTGIVHGFDPGRLTGALLLLGFGALYLYARGGIGPRFPME
jgi:hypothetical protein